ncbi:SLBB domain-containing protein [Desulfonema limicola]|uniref:SLBB domain-containing protein n=1 Tax=Desulfonema limicola TaxID=45656 RepID=A0A975BDK7_9BACT|nr:SLBB domain-containing protein [Desulfonema limicola]QTA83214.1 SLBB domain-containing protein [Desulfonema limicola]
MKNTIYLSVVFFILLFIPSSILCQETAPAAASVQGTAAPAAPAPVQGTAAPAASAPVFQGNAFQPLVPAPAANVSQPPQTTQDMPGTLTPEEIDQGKKLLEEGKKEDQKTPDTQVSEDFMEDTFLVKKENIEYPKLEIFGHNLFSYTGEGSFKPVLNMPVSDDYIIGPGDSIRVVMWGRLDQSLELFIDNEGVLNFPQIGPLNVAGLKFKELKELIRIKAEAITGVSVSVSMGNLKTIQIFVLGEVKRPGLYTVSSLSTLINALFASGGPTWLGSLRDIELKRDGMIITTVDLYDFLLNGDIAADSRLMAGDVIFVPQAGPMVSVFGRVKRPAVYELKNMTLYRALELAGGLSPRAINQRIQIERAFENQFQIVQDISYEDFQNKPNILLQDGDLIRIFSMLPSMANAVFLYGNVLRPGQYEYSSGLKIKDIIPDTDSLKMDTYFEYALVKRYRFNDMKTELIPFDLKKLLVDNDPGQNIRLKPLDEIYIFDKDRFKDRAYARCQGAVRRPGKYYIDDMHIKDLILKAGNTSRDAFMDMAHLYRTNPETKEITIHTFNLEQALLEVPGHNLLLQDQDRIIVHNIREYEKQYNVSANGALNKPGTYPYASNMDIRDLILVAGNVKDTTYMKEAELIRYEILDGHELKTSIIKFNVSLALDNHPEHNLKLNPMDTITLKQVPEWADRRVAVKITGEVVFPGNYPILPNDRLSDIIERAGGYTEYAYYQGAVFTRKAVKDLQQKRLNEMIKELELGVARLSSEDAQSALSEEDAYIQKQYSSSQKTLISKLKVSEASGRVVTSLLPLDELKGSELNIVLEDGDTLNIPRKPATINVLGAVYNPCALIFDPANSELEYYLARTGGPTEYAKADDIYVIRVDGTVTSSHDNSWWRDFKTTNLNPGDTILVPEEVVKPNYLRDTKDITEIIYQLAVTAGITITQVF